MQKANNKSVRSKYRNIFCGIWISSIIIFILTFTFSTNFFKGTVQDTKFGNSDYFIYFFLGSIGVGILSFIAMILSNFIKEPKKKKSKKATKSTSSTANKFIWISVFALLVLVSYLSAREQTLISNQKAENYKTLNRTKPTPTPVATSTPTIKPKNNYVDPDPVINCNIHASCGGGTRQMRKSECANSTCCQVGNNWSMYPSKSACTQAQDNYYSVKTGASSNNYPPCTVYYPALGYSQTYSYISPSQCLSWQNSAKLNNNNYTPPTTNYPTYVPSPTQDPYLQDLLDQLAIACQQAVSDWNSEKEQFYSTEYNNFSSSFEAVQELERRRQLRQQEMTNAGCTQVLSL